MSPFDFLFFGCLCSEINRVSIRYFNHGVTWRTAVVFFTKSYLNKSLTVWHSQIYANKNPLKLPNLMYYLIGKYFEEKIWQTVDIKIKQAEVSIFLLLTTLWNIILMFSLWNSSSSNVMDGDDKMPLSEPRFVPFVEDQILGYKCILVYCTFIAVSFKGRILYFLLF